MWDPKKDKDLQNAIRSYLAEHGMDLAEDVEYQGGIDFVSIEIGGVPVFEVGLPPVSNYPVYETEHTDRYLRKRVPIAV